MDALSDMRAQPNLLEDKTPWVIFFRWLGQNKPFPPPQDAEENVRSFAEAVLTVPGVIAIVGIVFSLMLFCCLCCCRFGRRQSVTRPWAVKPSSKPLLCMATLAFAVIIIGSIACWESGGKSFLTATHQFDRLVDDLNSAVDRGNALNFSGTDILTRLDQLQDLCPKQVYGIIESQLAKTRGQLKDVLTEVRTFTRDIEPLAQNLTDVHKHSAEVTWLTEGGLAVPMVLVTASCFIITLATLATRGCGGRHMAECNDCCLIRLGALFIASTVLLATLVAAGETTTGVVVGSFCANVDANALAYAQYGMGEGSVAFQATSHYITGAGDNPLDEPLDKAGNYTDSANKTLAKFDEQYGVQIQAFCQNWVAAPVYQDVSDVFANISATKTLVSRTNVYPYYRDFVQEDMCNTVITGLGWLVVIQLVVGLFFLPVVACMAGAFFTNWAAWQESTARGLLGADGGNRPAMESLSVSIRD